MQIRWAEPNDRDAWLDLATDVAPIFEAPDMPIDPEFHEYIDSRLQGHSVFIAEDKPSKRYLGLIAFSREHNRITWLGVFESERGRGVGSKLLERALKELDLSKAISVVTYRKGYKPGEPARALYKKFGFIDEDNGLYDNLGNPRCRMELKPGCYVNKKQ